MIFFDEFVYAWDRIFDKKSSRRRTKSYRSGAELSAELYALKSKYNKNILLWPMPWYIIILLLYTIAVAAGRLRDYEFVPARTLPDEFSLIDFAYWEKTGGVKRKGQRGGETEWRVEGKREIRDPGEKKLVFYFCGVLYRQSRYVCARARVVVVRLYYIIVILYYPRFASV